MILFRNNSDEEPFIKLRESYLEALSKKQFAPEAVSISSYDSNKKEVNSRFVNLKIVDGKDFIFFTNYESNKSDEFKSHKQISALLYWDKINLQIRMKANIKKTSRKFNQEYFFSRSPEKNALAISSRQSSVIKSFDEVKIKYQKALKEEDLLQCPEYWGGYQFKPFQIEFWEGNEFRINKRDLYMQKGHRWNHTILEP